MARSWAANTGTSPIAYAHQPNWVGTLDSAKTFSISLWITVAGYVTGTDGIYLVKADTFEGATTKGLFAVISNGTSSTAGTLRFNAMGWATTGGTFTIPGPTASAAWHHLAITYNASSTANKPIIYLDGTLQTVTTATTPAGTYTFADGAPLYIGSDSSGNFAPQLSAIADVAIWPGVILSVTEMQTIWRQGLRANQIRQEQLGFYVPLVGASNPEVDYISRAGGLTNFNGGGASTFVADPGRLTCFNFHTSAPYAPIRTSVTFIQALNATASSTGQVSRLSNKSVSAATNITGPTLDVEDFESGTISAYWTTSGGVGSSDTTRSVTGTKSWRIVPTADVQNVGAGTNTAYSEFSTYFRLDSSSTGVTGNKARILGFESGGWNQANGVFLWVTKTAGGYALSLARGSVTLTTTTILVDTWYAVRFCVFATSGNSTDHADFYLNGVLQQTLTGMSLTTLNNNMTWGVFGFNPTVFTVNFDTLKVYGVQPALLIKKVSASRSVLSSAIASLSKVKPTPLTTTMNVSGFVSRSIAKSLTTFLGPNVITNPSFTGAIAGTPGTDPTGMTHGGSSGLTYQVVGTGVEAGMNYVEIRWSGTTTANGNELFVFDNSPSPAVIGQTWFGSFSAKMSGGSLTNILDGQLYLGIVSDDASFNYINGAFPPFIPDGSIQPQSLQLMLPDVGTAYVNLGVYFNCNTGVAIDITLRLYVPVLYRNTFGTSVLASLTAIKHNSGVVLTAAVNILSSLTRSGVTNRTTSTAIVATTTKSEGHLLLALTNIVSVLSKKISTNRATNTSIIAALSRIKTSTLAAVTSVVLTTSRSLATSRTVIVTTLTTLSKAAAAQRATLVTVAGSLSPSLARHQTLTAASAISASLRRTLGVTRATAITALLVLNKGLTTSKSVTLTIAASLLAIKAKIVVLTAASSIATSLTRSLTHSTIAVIGVVASLLHVIQRALVSAATIAPTLRRAVSTSKSALTTIMLALTAIGGKSLALTSSAAVATSLGKTKRSALAALVGVAGAFTKTLSEHRTTSTGITTSLTSAAVAQVALAASSAVTTSLVRSSRVVRAVTSAIATSLRIGVGQAARSVSTAVSAMIHPTFTPPSGHLVVQIGVATTLTKTLAQRFSALVGGLVTLLRNVIYAPSRDLTIINDAISVEPTIINERITQPGVINDRIDA